MVKADIENSIVQYLFDQPVFLVEVLVKKGNVIDVFIDGDKGVTIEDCVRITRFVESKFDREVEDYELRVSSPGIERPFVMNRQYNKYLEREITVITKENIKKEGTLKSVNEEGIEMAVKSGKKSKEISMEKLLFSDIKEAKAVISFKSN